MQGAPFSIRQLLSAGGWVSLGKVLTILAGVAVNALLTRMLAPDEIGVYFLIVSLVTTAVLLAQMGLNQAAVRFIAELRGCGTQSGIRDVVIKCFAMVGFASALAGLLYLMFATTLAADIFHAPMMSVGALLLALWIVLTSLRSLAAECLRGFEDIARATLFEGLLTSLLFLLFVGAIWLDERPVGLYQVIVLMLAAAMISAGSAVFSVWRKIALLGTEKIIMASRMIRTALPLLGSNVMFVLLSSFGLWVVGSLASAEDAAQYGAATRLVALAQFPLLALNAIVPPMIARMYARNELAEMQRLLRWCASLALLLTAVVMIVFIVWGGGLLGLLFGNFYAQGYWILILLGLGVLANAWAGYCGPALMMSGYQNVMLRLAFVAVLITVPTAFALGMAYGAAGVAAAMSLGMLLLHVFWWLAVRRRLGIWTHAGVNIGAFAHVR